MQSTRLAYGCLTAIALLQGPLPPALGKQPALESADLSSNLFSGPLDTFTSELPDESRMYRLNLAFNSLTGPVSGLGKLGVFREVAAATGPSGRAQQTSTHVLNISSNNFQGELPFEFYGAASAGGPARLPRLDVRTSFTPCSLLASPSLLLGYTRRGSSLLMCYFSVLRFPACCADLYDGQPFNDLSRPGYPKPASRGVL